MQLKRFSGASPAAIIAQIKAELGTEAIILDTQEQDGIITMTAALERTPVNTSQESGGEFAQRSEANGWQNWQDEWGAIKGHLLSLMKQGIDLGNLDSRQRLALEFLQKEGLADDVFVELFKKLAQNKQKSILDCLGEIVKVMPFGKQNWPEKIHIVAGPFGVGKTSVLLRFALLLQQEDPKCKFCLINADASRGNGRLFLKNYCELAGMSYKEAASGMELGLAVQKAQEEGFAKIFVDIPGLSRGKNLHELLYQVGFEHFPTGALAVHLVMSPHYGEGHLRDFFMRYSTKFRSSVVWTKLDEAERYASLVNAAFGSGLPVSALSFGAGMGNSLKVAESKSIWRLLFKRELPS